MSGRSRKQLKITKKTRHANQAEMTTSRSCKARPSLFIVFCADRVELMFCTNLFDNNICGSRLRALANWMHATFDLVKLFDY